MKIGIMTDVNAGLDYVGYDTKIVCLRSSVNFKERIYVDGIDIKADQFYERISKITSVDEIPSTSAPSLGDVHNAIQKFIDEGYTDIIHYPISFELSATGPTVASLAKEYSDRINIHVINTKTACYMQGYMAVCAKKMVDEGKSVDEIIAYSNYLVEHNTAFFVVNDLSYLVKNGRLSGAAGFFAGLLKIKPVLQLTPEGKIITKEKIKTHSRAVERAIDLLKQYIDGEKNVKFFVFHSLCKDLADEVANSLHNARPDAGEIEIHFITPAVGAHIGAGVIGMCAFILPE